MKHRATNNLLRDALACAPITRHTGSVQIQKQLRQQTESAHLLFAEGLTRHGVVAAVEGATPHRRGLRFGARTHVVNVGVVGGTRVV